jgi:hypothetical protein
MRENVQKGKRKQIIIPAIITLVLYSLLILVLVINKLSLSELFVKDKNDLVIQFMENEGSSGAGSKPELASVQTKQNYTKPEKNPFSDQKISPSKSIVYDLSIHEKITDTVEISKSVSEFADTRDSINYSSDTLNFWSMYYGNQRNGSGLGRNDSSMPSVYSMPRFLGSDPTTAFNIWVVNRFKLPDKVPVNYQEKFFVSFIINVQGQLQNISVSNCTDQLVADEILKVLKSSPLWTPGKWYGHDINIMYNMPVTIQNSRN